MVLFIHIYTSPENRSGKGPTHSLSPYVQVKFGQYNSLMLGGG
jgi:hypothetical protein